MGIKRQQLTPFEHAEHKRQESAKRLTGIIVATAMVQRVKLLSLNRVKMTKKEQLEWETMLAQVIQHQIQHFGFDA